MIDNIVSNEPKHPSHEEVEIECLKVIQKMKNEAKSDKTTNYRVIYDRNIKILTDKSFKLADIADFINPFPAFRGTLVKIRSKDQTRVPKTLQDLNIKGDYCLTNNIQTTCSMVLIWFHVYIKRNCSPTVILTLSK